MRSQSVHISPNTLQGSLQDVSVSRLLDSCKKSLVTGRIDVDTGVIKGWIELRAGMVEAAEFGTLNGGAALTRLRGLNDGSYEISQRLPGLDGKLGSAAAFRGELSDVSLVELMRHCEDNALTCTIVIIHEFDRGEIDYRGGEIARVALNGVTDEDRIVDMVRLEDARFMVSAPPLDVGVDGWPVIRGDPTAPFRIEHLAARPRARKAAGSSPPPLPGAPPSPKATPAPLPGTPPPPAATPAPLPDTPPPPRARFREALDEPATAPSNAPVVLADVSQSAPVSLVASGCLNDRRSAPEDDEDDGFLDDVLVPGEASSSALALVAAKPESSWVSRPPPSPYSDFKKPRSRHTARVRAPRRRKSWLRRLLARFFERLPI